MRLLGGFELADGQRIVHRLPSRAITLLLARLAMGAGREHGREELIDLLWPAVALDVGRNRLRQALSALRSVLEPVEWPGAPVLLADRRTVRLLPGGVGCDVTAFVHAAQAGDSLRARQLYGGELLPGYFDEWVLDERRHLAALHEALPLAPHSLPVADAAAAPSTPAQHRLPLYLSRMLGVEAAAAALVAAVQAQRLVVLRGPGGVGKTRLSVEVARILAAAPTPAVVRSGDGSVTAESGSFDTVVFVPLAACATRQALLDAVLRALRQDAATDAEAAAQRLAQTLADRRVLLVLDNFEQLVEAGRDDLATWLSRLPQLHLLVTSRRVLGLDGEHEQVLSALPLPPPGAALAAHAQNPAVALFADRARAVRADFHLGERNHAQVAAIVHQLQGLPLAIELAAARLRSVSLADMLAMLRGDGAAPSGSLALLARAGPRAADDARHASMLRVVAWSWDLLSPAQQQLLGLLGACDGGAGLAVLAAADTRPRVDLAVALDELVAASVAYVREGVGGHGRYHAFEPVREFMRQTLPAHTQAQLAQAQLRGVLHWAAQLGHAPALDAYREELPNLVLALHTAALGDAPVQALDLAARCQAALDDVALPPSAVALLRRVVVTLEADPATATLHRDAITAAHGLLAEQSFDIGERGAAHSHAQHVLALLAAEGLLSGPDAPLPPPARVRALYGAVRVLLRVDNDVERVRELTEIGLRWARHHRQPHNEARLLTFQAVLAVRVEHDMARDVALKRQALALWQAHGAPARIASAQVGLAVSLGFVHRPAEQLPLLDDVHRLASAQGQITLVAFARSVKGYALADLRRWPESAQAYLECLQTAWPASAWREWFYALWNLPRTLAHGRRPEPAALLMAYAEPFYAQRFGQLGWEDLREQRRTRRLVCAQLGPAATARLWQQGSLLGMGEAMALACAEAEAASRLVPSASATPGVPCAQSASSEPPTP